MGLVNSVFFPRVLGYVSVRFRHRHLECFAKPSDQGFPHDSHERRVAVWSASALSVRKRNLPFVKRFVARFAQCNQIIRRVSADSPALFVMHMKLYASLFRRTLSAALTGVVVPFQYILANVVLIIHFSQLVIRSGRERFPFFHCLQALHIKLRCFHNHLRYRKEGADSPYACDMLLNFDFHRRREPALMLSMDSIVEPCLSVPGLAVPSRTAVLPSV